jgi:hypothetical protein
MLVEFGHPVKDILIGITIGLGGSQEHQKPVEPALSAQDIWQ